MLDCPARFAHVFRVRSRVDRHQADKGDGGFTSGEFRLHLTAAYLVATDALTEAGFVLVKKQNCLRAYSIELWTGVRGESQTSGGEETIGVEGGGPGCCCGQLAKPRSFRFRGRVSGVVQDTGAADPNSRSDVPLCAGKPGYRLASIEARIVFHPRSDCSRYSA